MCVKHGIGVVLILHANIQHLVVSSLGPEGALVEPRWVQDIGTLQTQSFFKEREVEEVPCAQNDGIHVVFGAIFEMDGASFDLGEQWFLCYLRGPLETHWPRLVADYDLLSAILEGLHGEVLGGVA